MVPDYVFYLCPPVHEMTEDEFGETIAPLGSIKEMDLQAGCYVQRLRAKKFLENPGSKADMTNGIQIDTALRGCVRGDRVQWRAVCVPVRGGGDWALPWRRSVSKFTEAQCRVQKAQGIQGSRGAPPNLSGTPFPDFHSDPPRRYVRVRVVWWVLECLA